MSLKQVIDGAGAENLTFITRKALASDTKLDIDAIASRCLNFEVNGANTF